MERLRDRRAEIEHEALTRVHSIADPVEVADPEYADGLKLAVSTAVEYGLAVLEEPDDEQFVAPAVLLGQARLAARNGVNLDTVLRRYFAGYTLFGNFLVREALGDDELTGERLTDLLRRLAIIFDRVIAAITEEYRLERARCSRSTEQERVRLVQGLLDGELVDPSALAYDLDAWHLGVVAVGPEGGKALRKVARTLDRALLLVQPWEGTAWAWMGGRRRIKAAEVLRCAATAWPGGLVAAVGQPADGVSGWRTTHRQARNALRVGLRDSEPIVTYAEAGLFACVLRDDLLISSLRQLYLEPLAAARDGGAALRGTLRAYFRAGGHVSSTAAALGVTRRTVNNRLRTIEEKLGGSIANYAVDLQIALRLADPEGQPASGAQAGKGLLTDSPDREEPGRKPPESIAGT